ncbi:hypothetical protein COX00_00570 [Candidatus Uhrbacteria bacterium CG22_combo_CG10-13_8_21_14_all_47_17]|uniref:Uncharacterized protein n=1 Tax=Candidatus Uhrbacteria bacterium CG22_combo_CG10-13_8_21_14_all_47_17 TaxID=1975041 RepID=A0A2H0BTH9_9BACT|nr:MAG: hypothetical protein COX00_00570 [Candidatus Uhrbacteria bacterium CG22_combo_CG10-13_8_21_14_all_47_17]
MAKAKTKSYVKKERKQDPGHEPDFWAFLTIAAFPIAMLIASTFGATPISSFLFGMYGTFAILVANAITEGRLWMFAPHWRARFEHPEFSFRLAVVSGAILLLLETVLIVLLFTGGGFDRTLLQLVFGRQCHIPTQALSGFCQTLRETLR